MFGLGMVEPTNAMDLSKLEVQPTHPELLEDLTTDFITHNYDLRASVARVWGLVPGVAGRLEPAPSERLELQHGDVAASRRDPAELAQAAQRLDDGLS